MTGDFKIDKFICTVDEALTYMKIHAPDCFFNPKNASPVQNSQVQDRRGVLERPKIEVEITEDEWQGLKQSGRGTRGARSVLTMLQRNMSLISLWVPAARSWRTC